MQNRWKCVVRSISFLLEFWFVFFFFPFVVVLFNGFLCLMFFFLSMASPRFILNIIWLTSLCKFYMFFCWGFIHAVWHYTWFDCYENIYDFSFALFLFSQWNFCYKNFTRLKPHVNWQWMRCQHKFVDFMDKYSRIEISQMLKIRMKEEMSNKKNLKIFWKIEQKKMDKSKRKVEGKKKQKSLGHEKKTIENYFLLTMVLSSRSINVEFLIGHKSQTIPRSGSTEMNQ